MFQKYRFHLLLHLIIFMWGFTGILGKLITLEMEYLVWFRTIIAFVSLMIGLYFLKMPMRIPNKKAMWKVFGVGIIVSLHWISFYASIKMSTASLGILCLSTATLHVTWIEPLVFKKRFSWVEFLFGSLVIFGIYIVSHDFGSDEYWALGIGLFSALCAGLFSVFNAKLAEEVPAPAITLHEMGIGALFLTCWVLVSGKMGGALDHMTWGNFGWLLFLGICCTSFAFVATIEVMKRLGAFTVSLSINLEPVYTILLAIPILHENKMLNGKFYAGSAMIILVVIVNAIYKSRQRAKSATDKETTPMH